ncbi:2-succinylbenzoate--CoA ligase [Chroococcidiopsis sp. CCMEE 29]|uniref:2-succinylbenzoate--CoA ligase n=1 Tax=Chroococcidiopsis sp. CCMEE 29 TaxID=155894 RepID=UPI0020208458|nr:2-succinylbenzoate--CoA ligase [Chroococcidiopsis sp. CCMEE 29]
MERPIAYLKNPAENWLICDRSQQFTQLAEQLYLELTQLLQQGTVPKILLAEREPVKFLAGFIAACAAGCPVFLCNPNWVKQEWQQVFELVQPDLVLGYGDWGLAIKDYYPSPQPAIANPQWIMIPTGGSSGKIRFAIHTWETLMASVQGFQQYFQLNQVNSFCVLPLYHVSGLMQFLRSLTTGGQLVVLPFKALEAGEKTDINPSEFFISLVPTQLQRLLQQPPLASWLSEFQTVLLGGAPAWQELLEQARHYGIHLAPTYGMTETASQIATLKPKDFLNGYNHCGQVLPHAKVTIHSPTNQVLGVNQTGIITIQAKSLALGYYPELFANNQHFQLDDIGFLNNQGYLNVVGRSSNKIITGGENVYPNEVEAAIRATHLVDDVCVIGLPNHQWGQVVTAIYVPNNSFVTPATLQAAITDKLSKFKQPKYWISLQKLPRNTQGKINHEHLYQIATELLPLSL